MRTYAHSITKVNIHARQDQRNRYQQDVLAGIRFSLEAYARGALSYGLRSNQTNRAYGRGDVVSLLSKSRLNEELNVSRSRSRWIDRDFYSPDLRELRGRSSHLGCEGRNRLARPMRPSRTDPVATALHVVVGSGRAVLLTLFPRKLPQRRQPAQAASPGAFRFVRRSFLPSGS